MIHDDFAPQVQKAILKGATALPRGVQSSKALAPADFEAERSRLAGEHGRPFSDEEVSTSFLYPKVFSDYLKQIKTFGDAVTNLPTPAFWYGMEVSSTITLKMPASRAEAEFGYSSSTSTDPSSVVSVEVKLVRVSGKKHKSMRTLDFLVTAGDRSSKQEVVVKDSAGEDEFTGPMAKAGEKSQIGSPMPGLVEKCLVKVGSSVAEGDTMFVVSAMKMEVNVKAPFTGKVAKLTVAAGDKVVEGALLAVLAE